MNETLIAFLIIFGFILLLLILSLVMNIRKTRIIKSKIVEEYGKTPVWSLDERDYNSMKNYYRLNPLENNQNIDVITWNDLNMDSVFKRIKNTQSSIGDEYFYRFMRHQKNNNLNHFDEVVESINNKPTERLKLQYAFHKIGRHTGNRMVECLYDTSLFPKMPMGIITLVTFIGLLSIVSLNINLDIGVLAICASFTVSMILFVITIKKIATYIINLKIISEMINAAKVIVKMNISELDEENNRLKKLLKKCNTLGDLSNFCVLVSMSDSEQQMNNLLAMLVTYFGLYGFAYQATIKQLRKYATELMEIYDIVGYVESTISVASYRKSVNYYCKPTFIEGRIIDFNEIVHPLIKKPVANTNSCRNKILITGSNASGKSTFVKTIAINVILGQLINTCLAKSFKFRPCTIYTSMNLEDDLEVGNSFYVAEVKSLKRLLDESSKDNYSMLFIDEIFKGTNMIERIAAATVILQHFARKDCFICLATHDIELASTLDKLYDNYHFQEEIKDDDICFDYLLKSGITTGSNAIKLLSYCKYDSSIVTEAQSLAEYYRHNGEWKK